MNHRSIILAAAAWVIAAVGGGGAARAHPPIGTLVTLTAQRDGEVTLTVHHDAIAFALNESSTRVTDEAMFDLVHGPVEDLDAALADARRRLPVGLRLTADGRDVELEIVESPSLEVVLVWKKAHPNAVPMLRMDFVLRGRLATLGSELTIRFPEVLGDVILIVEPPGAEGTTYPILPGAESAAFRLGTPDPFWAMSWRYAVSGFRHILPAGLDHCLFVFGLFLLTPRFKTVLWQITAFTIAHTITLSLTSMQVIGLPAYVVEPAIAASIAFIGVENLVTTKVHPWRPAVAFLFGLVHGMGVATAFDEMGFPKGQLVPTLAAFTAGVEAGHLTVLAGAFALLGWTRNKPWYRHRVTIPLSLAIAVVATYWLVERVASPGG